MSVIHYNSEKYRRSFFREALLQLSFLQKWDNVRFIYNLKTYEEFYIGEDI